MKNNNGFTLIEVMVTTVIVAMIMSAAYYFWTFFNDNYHFTLEQSRNLDDSYWALTRLVKELREMETAQGGSYELEQADDQEIIFYADIDQDNIAERVHYWLDGTNLMRGVTEPSGDPVVYDTGTQISSLIIENIANGADPMFFYYNRDWPTDTTNNPLSPGERLLSTTLINVTIAIKTTSSQLQDPVELSQSVSLRRLRAN